MFSGIGEALADAAPGLAMDAGIATGKGIHATGGAIGKAWKEGTHVTSKQVLPSANVQAMLLKP